jgi:putative tricarboxylic transport membrane protein
MTSANQAAAPRAPGETPRHTWAQRAPGALLVVLGLAAGLEATTFDVAFLTDPVGPKALPFVVSVALLLSGLHELARPGAAARWPGRGALSRIGIAGAAFIVYALVLPRIGFLLSTVLVVTVLSRLFGAALRRCAPAAVALAFTLWLLFVWLLGLSLPVGDLWLR